MGAIAKCVDTTQPLVMREYEIGGTKYIVKATVRAGASEDAAAKVRRLLRREITEISGRQINGHSDNK